MSDDLVERMAEALWQAESERAAGRRRLIPWEEEGADMQNWWRIGARAALAVAEPAIRERERDRAVALVENTPSPGEAYDTEVGPRYAAGYRDASNHAADALTKLARAIRTGAAP